MANDKKYDLKERILNFVLSVIELVRKLSDTRINRIFIDQIVRSASSVGSNYEEADGTLSRKDFVYKMGIVKKESKETKYWLTLIRHTNDRKFTENILALEQENLELIKIFSTIINKTRQSIT